MTVPPEREIGRDVVGALHHSTGSYELVIAAIAAAGFGYLIDRAFGLTPLFTLIFAAAGFIGGAYTLWLNYTTQMATASTARTTRSNETTASASPDDVNAANPGDLV